MERKITFDSNGLKLAGILRLPEGSSNSSRLPAIVITHPYGGVSVRMR